MNKLIKKGISYLSTDLLSNLIALATLVLITNNTDLAVFGLFVLIQTTIYLIESVFNFQGWQGLVKFGVKPFSNSRIDRVEVLLSRCLSIDILGAKLCTLVHIPVIFGIMLVKGNAYSLDLYILTLFFGVSYYWRFSNIATGLFRIAQEYQLINLRSLVVSISRLFFVILLMSSTTLKVENLLFVFGLSELFGTFVSYYIYRQHARRKKIRPILFSRFKFKLISSFYFKYCFYCWWSSLFSTVTKQIDILIVGLFINNESAGILRVIKQISRVVSMVTNPINIMLFPEFSRLVAEGNLKVLYDKLNVVQLKIFVLFMVLYLPFFYFSEDVISIFGEEFKSGTAELSLYMFAVMFSVAFSLYHPLLMSINRVKELAVVNTVNSIVYLILMIPSVYFFGLLGYVFSFLIFMVLSVLSRFYLFNRERRVFNAVV